MGVKGQHLMSVLTFHLCWDSLLLCCCVCRASRPVNSGDALVSIFLFIKEHWLQRVLPLSAFHRFWELNSGPHACPASTLPTDPGIWSLSTWGSYLRPVCFLHPLAHPSSQKSTGLCWSSQALPWSFSQWVICLPHGFYLHSVWQLQPHPLTLMKSLHFILHVILANRNLCCLFIVKIYSSMMTIHWTAQVTSCHLILSCLAGYNGTHL